MAFSVRMAGLRALEVSGLNYLVRQFHSGRLLIFCYHGVVSRRLARHEANFETTVSAGDFATHLRFFAKRFRPVALQDVRTAIAGGKPLPPRAVLITFDDGYRNVYTHAAPILREHGIPAAVFLSTAYIGSDSLYWYDEVRQRLDRWQEPQIEMPGGGPAFPWPGEARNRDAVARRIRQACKRVPNQQRLDYLEYLRAHTQPLDLTEEQHHVLDPMNWTEARGLLGMGFEIGSHTVTHPILTNIAADDLDRELTDSKAEIERRIGTACYSIAWPNGTPADFSPAVTEAARHSGYELAFTMVERMNRPDSHPYMLNRIAAPGHVPMIALRVRASGLYSLLNA